MYYAAVRRGARHRRRAHRPGPFRDDLYLRLVPGQDARAGGGSRSPLTKRDRAWQRTVFDEVAASCSTASVPFRRAAAVQRADPRGARSRRATSDAVLALARFDIELGAARAAGSHRRDGDRTVMGADAALLAGRHPLRFRRDGDRLLWLPPAGIASRSRRRCWTHRRHRDLVGPVLVPLQTSKTQYLIRRAPRSQVVDAGDGTVEVQLALERGWRTSRGAAGRPLKPGD